MIKDEGGPLRELMPKTEENGKENEWHDQIYTLKTSLIIVRGPKYVR